MSVKSVNSAFISKSFFKYIRKSNLLDKNTERAYIERYKETGDIEYRDKVILANIKFVVRSTLECKTPNVDTEDLFCEGLYGLIHAIDHFDSEGNDVKFISYAVYWIQHYIKKFINDSSEVKVPTAVAKKIRKMLVEDNYDEHGNDVVTIQAVNAVSRPLCIDERMDDSKHCVADVIADTRIESADKRHYKQTLSEEFVAIINGSLPPLKADIIIKTYGLDNSEVEWTLRDISHQSKYSHERIRQLRKEALRDLKNNKDILKLRKKYEHCETMV